MAFAVGLNTTKSEAVEPAVTKSWPLASIREKIESVDALGIEYIGNRILEKVLNNLGPTGKARVAQQVMQKKGQESDPRAAMMLRIMMQLAIKETEESGASFFSNREASQFYSVALYPVKEKIAHAFSRANGFIESGLYLEISDYDPVGFLAETAKKIKKEITLIHVPSHYMVCLKLDTKLTQEKSELVFVLTQESDGVVFSQETFTIKQLKEEFRSIVLSGIKDERSQGETQSTGEGKTKPKAKTSQEASFIKV